MYIYTLRRLLFAVPTLLVISFIIFAILDLSPGDPMSQVPLTVPPDVRAKIIETLGLNEPFHIRYLLWLNQFFINEPLNLIQEWTGIAIGDPDRLRVRSWITKAPVVDLIVQRLPQTLWVVGLAYLFGVLLAVPIGVISAYKQYSWFDQLGTLFSLIGFSVPTFLMGTIFILVFAVNLGWFPDSYDTTLQVRDWPSFLRQVEQMVLPVSVLALFNAAQISRFMRASMLENLTQDYVRTARSKGLRERIVLLTHVLRNSMIPVVTIIAIGIPQIFAGAIITEQIFRVNGLGALLIVGIEGADYPLVQTLTFIFAVLIVLFNLIADILYGILDPRIRYD
ncbi:MAG TPA: ABC transporter permease [Paracoccaceae bacterium]|nr:ABC transporter permease [Paracoccaceae bacterium]